MRELQNVDALTFRPNLSSLVGLQESRSYRKIVVSNFTTSVGTETPNPKSFTLKQNYPNPFNPSTTIRYALPTAGRVKLTLCNVLGLVVGELVN